MATPKLSIHGFWQIKRPDSGVVRHPSKELHASLEIPVWRAIQTLPVSGQQTAAEITCSPRAMSRAEEFFWGQAQPETKLSKLKTVPVEKSEIPCY
jgi:hypothetical protein